MTNETAWLDVLLVVEEDKFFTRAKSGAIWGTVYFQIGDSQFFPQRGWTDLLVGFVAAWLQGLLRVTRGIVEKERVEFYDGPFAIEISIAQEGHLNLNFVHQEKSELSKLVDARHMLAQSDSVGKELLAKCEHKGWNNKDIETLSAIIKQIQY